MNRIPVELEEDIISRVTSFRSIYKLSLYNRNARRRLIQIGRDLATAYMLELGSRGPLADIPATESLKDIQIFLLRLVIIYHSEGQLRQTILKYCTVQYPKPQSIRKLKRFALKAVETYINGSYLDDPEFAYKFNEIVDRFKARNPNLSAPEKVYLLREIITAYDKFELEEYWHSQVMRLIRNLARKELLSSHMVEQLFGH